MPASRTSLLLCLVLAGVAGCQSADQAPQAAAEASPSDAQASDSVIQATQLLDDWGGEADTLAQARALLDAALAADPDDHLAKLQLARYAVMSGRLGGSRGALEMIDQMLAADPDFAEAHVLRIHVLTNLGLGLEPTVWDSISAARRLNSTSPWLILNVAQIELQVRSFKTAAENCETVINRDPPPNAKALASAYQCRMPYLRQIRDWDGIERDHLAAVALQPDNAIILTNYALHLCRDRGDCAKAVPLVAKARKSANLQVMYMIEAGASYEAWANLAREKGDSAPETLEALAQAQRQLPNLNDAMASLGGNHDNEPLVKALLAQGADINASDDHGCMALLIASSRGDLEAVKVLLANGADVNAGTNGQSALMLAASEGYLDIVQLLIASGADERSRPAEAIQFAMTASFREVGEAIEAAFPVR